MTSAVMNVRGVSTKSRKSFSFRKLTNSVATIPF
jgi:hypothetical protein